MDQNRTQKELTANLKKKAIEEGFNPVGIANIPGSEKIHLRTAALQRWLKAGFQADMKWMEASRRNNIETLLEGAKSVLVVGLNYYVNREQSKGSLSIARYAWGRDYHRVLTKRLKRIGQWLQAERPNCKWKICVDSQPLLEKAWAEEAGLGWIGKNSNLINKNQGSWMVLGNLLCTELLIADEPTKPLCGKCEECIHACPTNAISEPFVIDSRSCLAYHTIENRSQFIPKEIQAKMGKWIAGCDICQDVCPWNKKKIPSNEDPEVAPREWVMNLTKSQALEWEDTIWDEKLQGSALRRIKPWMWRRNAKAIDINQKLERNK